MNHFNIANSFVTKKAKGYDVNFWCIDLHGTICTSTYKRSGKHTFYKDAKKVLQFLTKKEELILILSTCSHDDSIKKAREWLAKYDIHFKYVNENTEVHSDKISSFTKKYHFNVLLDDKAGFEAETDWTLVKKELEQEYGVRII